MAGWLALAIRQGLFYHVEMISKLYYKSKSYIFILYYLNVLYSYFTFRFFILVDMNKISILMTNRQVTHHTSLDLF